MTHHDLILQIEAFAAQRNWAPSTVTSRAVGNSRLYSRLKEGKSCTLAVAEKVQSFMAANRPSTETS